MLVNVYHDDLANAEREMDALRAARHEQLSEDIYAFLDDTAPLNMSDDTLATIAEQIESLLTPHIYAPMREVRLTA